jgi:UDP-N-acetylmuramoyl-tripeptide--D-alanyl-D-alanine ligase
LIDLTPERIKEVCGAALLAGGPGRIGPEDMPRRAVVDSREVGPGDLFVGIQGERADGGEFAEQAGDAGAWGVLVRPEHGLRVAARAGRLRVMSVDDPLAALGRLARAWVDRLWAEGCKVVGITGSTGKTSTKDILHALLTPSFQDAVHASPANYNTEVGLPLAVLSAEPETRVLVVEMAMRGPGQIRELCEIAPPEIGVITNVGPVHLELLGTIEAVAEAKAELIAALPPDGFCVVPAMAEALHPHLRREVRTLTFGPWPNGARGSPTSVERVAGAAADVRVLDAEPASTGDQTGLRAQIAIGAEQFLFEFNFRQAHNLVNALAAIGAAHALGVETDSLVAGARQVRFSELRGEEIELSNGVVVINDCYNANPISMRAALDHLADVAAQRKGARAVAVLGEMAELGPEAVAFHREIGEYAAARGVALVLAIGARGDAYLDGYGSAGNARAAADVPAAAAILRELIEPGDVVLVKGSRSVGLERVTERLTEDDAEDGR